MCAARLRAQGENRVLIASHSDGQTLVSHEYTAQTGEVAPKPAPIEAPAADSGDESPEVGSSKAAGGKARPPTLLSVLKPRLQKLIRKKDAT